MSEARQLWEQTLADFLFAHRAGEDVQEAFDALRARVDTLTAELKRARAAVEDDCADAYRRGYEAGEQAWIDGYGVVPVEKQP